MTPTGRDRPRVSNVTSVFDEVIDGSLQHAEHPAAPEPEPEPEPERPVPAARQRRRRGGNARPRSERPPFVTEAMATIPLQVKVPLDMHWDLKQAAQWQRSNMTRVVTALISIYTENSDLVERLIDTAEARDRTLGEFLADALRRAEP
jgi:hypothetical protein